MKTKILKRTFNGLAYAALFLVGGLTGLGMFYAEDILFDKKESK